MVLKKVFNTLNRYLRTHACSQVQFNFLSPSYPDGSYDWQMSATPEHETTHNLTAVGRLPSFLSIGIPGMGPL